MERYSYVKDPHNSTAINYSREPKQCDICGEKKAGYEGCYPAIEDEDTHFICEDCLIRGRIKEKRGEINQGSLTALREQLKELNPSLKPEEIEKIVKERNDELEHRTPHVTTWQEFYWPVHHGDYCVFIGEIGKKELDSLAPDGDGKKFLESLEEWQSEWGGGKYEKIDDPDWLWDYTPERAPRKEKNESACPIFLFQCKTCEKFVTVLDFD